MNNASRNHKLAQIEARVSAAGRTATQARERATQAREEEDAAGAAGPAHRPPVGPELDISKLESEAKEAADKAAAAREDASRELAGIRKLRRPGFCLLYASRFDENFRSFELLTRHHDRLLGRPARQQSGNQSKLTDVPMSEAHFFNLINYLETPRHLARVIQRNGTYLLAERLGKRAAAGVDEADSMLPPLRPGGTVFVNMCKKTTS